MQKRFAARSRVVVLFVLCAFALSTSVAEAKVSPETADLTTGKHRFQVDAVGDRGPEGVTDFETLPGAGGVRLVESRSGVTVATRGRSLIGCAADAGVLVACSVRVVDALGRELATGAAQAPNDAASVDVGVFRTPFGRGLLRENPTGIRGFVELTLTAPGGLTFTQRTATTYVASDGIYLTLPRSRGIDAMAEAQLRTISALLPDATTLSCTAHMSRPARIGSMADLRRMRRRTRAISTDQARAACAVVKRALPSIRTTARGLGQVQPRRSNATAKGQRSNRRLLVTFGF